MRLRLPLALALAAGAVMLLGAAQTAPGPSSDPATTAGCPIAVMAVMPLPGNGITASYAAFLASPRAGGVASGTLWVNTSLGPFHVPFAGRTVVGAPFTSGEDPIAFALPAAATLQNAFVDSLGTAPPCAKPGAWAPPLEPLLEGAVKRALAAALARPPAPVSATPIADPAAACHAPDTDAYLLRAAPVYSAPDLKGGTVTVRVHLSPESRIVSTEVEDPNSEVRYYNTRALTAARASIYVTRTVNCRPVEADFSFPAVFP